MLEERITQHYTHLQTSDTNSFSKVVKPTIVVATLWWYVCDFGTFRNCRHLQRDELHIRDDRLVPSSPPLCRQGTSQMVALHTNGSKTRVGRRDVVQPLVPTVGQHSYLFRRRYLQREHRDESQHFMRGSGMRRHSMSFAVEYCC